MQMLIVQNPDGDSRVFDLYGEDITIGREYGHDLQLTHPSVSREHASLTWKAGGYEIDDVGSHNGVYVNSERVTEKRLLNSGDVVQLGHFEVIYISGKIPDRFQKLNIPTLQRWYGVAAQASSDSTHQLSSTQMKRLLAARAVLERGQLVDAKGVDWRLGDQHWELGRNAAIPVSGLLVGKCVAELIWNGQSHVLAGKSQFCRIKVNGTSIQVCSLEDGDHIRIGNSQFTYEVRQ